MDSVLSFKDSLFGFVAVGLLMAGFDGVPCAAQPVDVVSVVDRDRAEYEGMALRLWELAEVGYKETRSSALLADGLESNGFKVERGVAGMPTAFIASHGSGHPVIAVLGEFDALPGLAQEAVAEKCPIDGQAAGHACGHHLFGAGSAAAVAAVREWMDAEGVAGTLRYYGTPAEEGGSGKVYMARAGLFDDVDVVLHWHPGDKNRVSLASSLAIKTGKFRFYGTAAHASISPDKGRSALDGVEAMDYMANMMREHVPQSARIHYTITNGGGVPNVVPAFAEVFYYVRHPRRDAVHDIWSWLERAAQGAAMGTGTRVDWEIVSGDYELLPNESLARLLHAQLEKVGGVTYDAQETVFAEKIARTLPGGAALDLGQPGRVQPLRPPDGTEGSASTDVGDVSWVVPTAGFSTACWVPGTPAHSWQATAAGGTTIGLKGMTVAAKTLALGLTELFTHPEAVAAAREEFERRRGEHFKYEPLLGDRSPPLDYRGK
jgi:aminobenzoyl-glutamate utilization protein B